MRRAVSRRYFEFSVTSGIWRVSRDQKPTKTDGARHPGNGCVDGRRPLERSRSVLVAEQVLRAPLPPHWKQYQRKDGSGEGFFYNTQTHESLLEYPQEGYFLELMALERKKKLSRGATETIPRPRSPVKATEPSCRDAELDELCRQHADEEKKRHDTALVQLRKEQQGEIEQIKVQYMRAIHAAEESQAEDVERLKPSHQKVICRLRKEQETKVAHLRESLPRGKWLFGLCNREWRRFRGSPMSLIEADTHNQTFSIKPPVHIGDGQLSGFATCDRPESSSRPR
jgi:hypothetical protein